MQDTDWIMSSTKRSKQNQRKAKTLVIPREKVTTTAIYPKSGESRHCPKKSKRNPSTRPFRDDKIQVSFLQIILRLGSQVRHDTSLFFGSTRKITDSVFNHEIGGIRNRHLHRSVTNKENQDPTD